MELPHTDIPAAEQEHAVQLLRGGLRGRFAQSFCVLQTTLDAMQSVLEEQANPALRETLCPLVDEIAGRLPALERLAEQAADIAVGSAMRGLHESEPVELVSMVGILCACVNEELIRRSSPAVLELERDKMPETLTLPGNTGLINALLANLISNSLQEKADVRMRLRLTADRRLLFRDDGPGLPETAWALLLEGTWQGELLHRGATGLLLVREYAACLGWRLERTDGGLAFVLPPAPQEMLLRSSAREALYAEQCRACIGRELDALRSDGRKALP